MDKIDFCWLMQSTASLLGTPRYLHNHAIIQAADRVAAVRRVGSCRYWSRSSVRFEVHIKFHNGVLGDCVVVVSARWFGVFKKVLTSCDFHVQKSLEFTQNAWLRRVGKELTGRLW